LVPSLIRPMAVSSPNDEAYPTATVVPEVSLLIE